MRVSAQVDKSPTKHYSQRIWEYYGKYSNSKIHVCEDHLSNNFLGSEEHKDNDKYD